MNDIFVTISKDISARPEQVKAAVALLDEGATVPFIARYRKEVTGGLDDVQLRRLEERLKTLRLLQARKESILKALDEKGVLTPNLRTLLLQSATRSELDALYAPFKTTRKSKADLAREAGLDKVTDAIIAGADIATLDVKNLDTTAAEEGVREILIDRALQNPRLVTTLREHTAKAPLRPRAARGKKEEAKKWVEEANALDTPETIPPHRALGLLRAMNDGIIALEIDCDDLSSQIARSFTQKRSDLISQAAQAGWTGRIGTSVKKQTLTTLKERAHAAAIDVFRKNLKDILLAAPAGKKTILGLDPGLRTGVKAAVIDPTGKVLHTTTLYLFNREANTAQAVREMTQMVSRYNVDIIAIGNGTGGRETDTWVGQWLKSSPKPHPQKVIASEAGASVYSASEIASRELPDMDVSLRGAVSIARRLQDPLAELVKIDPKSLGVGQYQHDIDPKDLEEALGAVVEDAVAAVGVNLNTASAALLAHVPGIGSGLAKTIVEYRDSKGPFKSRKDLLKVPRLGPKAYEQCVGFLRIPGAANPLDASAVHPESYDLAIAIAKACKMPLPKTLGNSVALGKLDPTAFKTPLTAKSVIEEMIKPGRDPRPEFKVAKLSDEVVTVKDLKPGMRLQGTVTNVAAFGAFVDIGVHQDGLIHISHLSDEFVSTPSDVISVGDVVGVTVLDVDVEKNRISLSRKSQATPQKVQESKPKSDKSGPQKGNTKGRSAPQSSPSESPFAVLKGKI